MHDNKNRNHMLYLCGAPRVSTRPTASLGGPRSHIIYVIQTMKKFGWKVDKYIVGDHVPEKWLSHDIERELKSVWIKRLLADLYRILSGFINSWRANKKYRDVELVYERLASFQAMGFLFKLRKIPWILETNGLYYVEAATYRKSIILSSVAKIIENFVYKQCDVLICITETLKNLIIKEFSIDSEKIIIVPNGVDIDFFDPSRYQPKRFFKELSIGYVGHLFKYYALDMLISSLAELRNEGIEMNLVIIGGGPMMSEWENLVLKFSLDKQVRFTGQIPMSEIPSHILGFDIGFAGTGYVYTGESYHSLTKIYEYMSMGRPVIASKFEETIRVIRQNETGFLYKKGDKEDLKKAIRMAYSQKNRWNKMGGLARKDMIENHSWTSRINDMVENMNGILH